MKRFRIINDATVALVFLFPSLVGFGIFYFIPFLEMIKFTLFDPVTNKFLGFVQYKLVITNQVFKVAFSNQMMLILLAVPIIVLISLSIAVLLERVTKNRNIFMNIMVIPLVIPTACVILFWKILFYNTGYVNNILTLLGIEPVLWLNSHMTRWVIILMFLWKNVGYNVILFYAGLRNVPEHFYESAVCEGASGWYIFRKITFIYTLPTTFFVFIISIVNSFKMFREIFLLLGSYPFIKVYSMQHYMNNLFLTLDISKLTCASIILIFVIYIIVLLFYRLQNKLVEIISN